LLLVKILSFVSDPVVDQDNKIVKVVLIDLFKPGEVTMMCFNTLELDLKEEGPELDEGGWIKGTQCLVSHSYRAYTLNVNTLACPECHTESLARNWRLHPVLLVSHSPADVPQWVSKSSGASLASL
jgi:nitrate reductase cytochrome c-type subunit